MREFKLIFPEEPKEYIILIDRLGDEWHKEEESWGSLNGVGYLWEELVEARGPLKEKPKPVTPGDFMRAARTPCGNKDVSDEFYLLHHPENWAKVEELIERIKNDG